MARPSLRFPKAASSMSKSDVKKFAKTKHKGLPNKVEVEEGHIYKTCKKVITTVILTRNVAQSPRDLR